MCVCVRVYTKKKKLVELDIFIVPLLTTPNFGIMLYLVCHGFEMFRGSWLFCFMKLEVYWFILR